jgi:hypothetical protein
VKDWQQLTEDDEQRKITEAVVWAALVYDLSGVTEKNIDEWRFRQEFARHIDDFYPTPGLAHKSTGATCSPALSSSGELVSRQM